MGKWRVGHKVGVNVYDDDRPVCQCHTFVDAALIVRAVNALQDRETAVKKPPKDARVDLGEKED